MSSDDDDFEGPLVRSQPVRATSDSPAPNKTRPLSVVKSRHNDQDLQRKVLRCVHKITSPGNPLLRPERSSYEEVHLENRVSRQHNEPKNASLGKRLRPHTFSSAYARHHRRRIESTASPSATALARAAAPLRAERTPRDTHSSSPTSTKPEYSQRCSRRSDIDECTGSAGERPSPPSGKVDDTNAPAERSRPPTRGSSPETVSVRDIARDDSIGRALHALASMKQYSGQIAFVARFPKRPAEWDAEGVDLVPSLQMAAQRALSARAPNHASQNGLRNGAKNGGSPIRTVHAMSGRVAKIDTPPLRLYSHQAATIRALQQGEDVMLCSSTSSGKTLAYTLPIVDAILRQPRARVHALCLYPVKALASDQKRAIESITKHLARRIHVRALDGDTPLEERDAVRKEAHVILTNPDMLHHSLLPSHARWMRFLRRLSYIVIDEAHTYRGIWGSHVANILRRLLRICEHYGIRPQIALCSATVANPLEHASRLTSRAPRLVCEDGSPSGERLFVLWDPPEIHGGAALAQRAGAADESVLSACKGAGSTSGAAGGAECGCSAGNHAPRPCEKRAVDACNATAGADAGARGAAHAPRAAAPTSAPTTSARASATHEATLISQVLVEHSVRHLAFVRARQTAENLAAAVRDRLSSHAAQQAVRAYRAGYSKEDRRQLEEDMIAGRTSALVTTNALELGIDIGDLDATVLVQLPSSVASLWQQAGRAGRRQQRSLVIVIPGSAPVERWIAAHPSFLLGAPIEEARIDPFNPYVLLAHLDCAACERFLDASDRTLFGASAFDAAVAELAGRGALRFRGTYWDRAAGAERPHGTVSLRSAQRATVSVLVQGSDEELEAMSEADAIDRLYRGAVYSAQGKTFISDGFVCGQSSCVLRPVHSISFYTVPLASVRVQSHGACANRHVRSAVVRSGRVHVRAAVEGFRKVKRRGDTVLDIVPLREPLVHEFDTVALWFSLPQHVETRIMQCHGEQVLPNVAQALANAIAAVLPVFAMCDAGDVASVACSASEYGPLSRLDGIEGTSICLYDRIEGGCGISSRAVDVLERIWSMSLDLIRRCACSGETGCPACVQALARSSLDPHKAGAVTALEGLLDAWA